MHASISHHAVMREATDQVIEAAQQLAAALSHAPGFVSYALLDMGGQLVSVSVFESRPELIAGDRLIGTWMAEHLPVYAGPSAVETGEIVLQRGM